MFSAECVVNEDRGHRMAYWLLKTEPSEWSWSDQLKEKRTHWDGVRNYQASANMKAMKVGDLCFFYHSVKAREIVGIVKVVKRYYPDHTDTTGRFGMVDVETVKAVSKPVRLRDIKADPVFNDFQLVRQSRLSVVPVSSKHWERLCKMAETIP